MPHALVLAAVWLSPAVLVAVSGELVADGTRGLWVPVTLGAGALVAAICLGGPWASLGRRVGGATVVELARRRWPERDPALAALGVPVTVIAALFLWAQLAVVRELGAGLGWSGGTSVAVLVGVLGLTAWHARLAWGVAVSASLIALLGLGVCLGAVMVTTDPLWPRVWDAVASRPMVFSEVGPWVGDGQPVQGPAAELTVTVSEEQRLTLLGPGRVRVELWEGRDSAHDIGASAEVTLRPGDRLIIPNGLRIRFQPGRAIPGAPASGADWLEVPTAGSTWQPLLGLGLTVLFGALGLAPAHAALPTGRPTGERGVALGAALVVLGAAGAMLWTLYAVWLAPEMYLGGVAALEIFELPVRVTALGAAAAPLGRLALAALGAGALAAGLAALRGLPDRRARGRAPLDEYGFELAVLVLAGALALVAPVSPRAVLVAAFGVAASASAPGALLACWKVRLTPRALAVGSGVGLALFATLSLLGWVGVRGGVAGSWVTWLFAWPVILAAPANGVAAWLCSPSTPPLVPRGELPEDLAALHGGG